MTDHAPTDARSAPQEEASSMREENPRTFPEGIPVRDAARTKFEPRAANEVLIITGYSGAVARVRPGPWKTSTGTSSTTFPRRCCPPWSA